MPTPASKDALVSILGPAYFQPIADLVDTLTSKPQPKLNAVQSGLFESGYTAAVVLLLVAMFESYVVRVRYIQRARVRATMRSALDVLLSLYPRLRHRKALTDVYVLRDVLFHNHLWEIEYSMGGSSGMILHGAAKDPAFGDKKYTARVDAKKRRTKALNLSIVPIRVTRRDARKVFETVWTILLFLESKNRNQCYVSHQNVRFRGKLGRFGELLKYF